MVLVKCLTRFLVVVALFASIALVRGDDPAGAKPIDIGSRLELFVDQSLIDSMQGVTRELHSPERKGAVFTFDRPWEGGATGCVTVFDDGIPGGVSHYRMYYVGVPMRGEYSDFPNIYGPAVVCTAESRDGIRWTRPNLELFKGEFIDRYKRPFTVPAPNNIVWLGQGQQIHSNDNFVPFKDSNPDCKPEARYKAIGRCLNLPDPSPPEPDDTGYPWPPGAGLVALQSPDRIHWSLMQEERIIKKTETDAQNVAFWDAVRGEYVCYNRVWGPGRFRAIQTTTSKDFLNWSDPPKMIETGGAPREHLYNPAILPYFRAPHIHLGMIMRLVGGRVWVKEHPEHEVSDAVFMSSRDGRHFDRSFMEGWIRPGLDPDRKSWIHGNTAPAWGMLQTTPEEISVYWQDHSGQLKSMPQLQRGTLRTDGFVSVHARYAGGEFTTKPLIFKGREFLMNYSTSAVGSVRLDLQDESGTPIPGFALADCPAIYGDAIEEVVKWKAGPDVSALAGKPIRLRFVMTDADLYSIRFRD
ncbi:MAG: hypothetical protein NT069_00280 [Planctomycetota bacterium]|nr:hypothetical protein [Planctomycetota bacterium]